MISVFTKRETNLQISNLFRMSYYFGSFILYMFHIVAGPLLSVYKEDVASFNVALSEQHYPLLFPTMNKRLDTDIPTITASSLGTFASVLKVLSPSISDLPSLSTILPSTHPLPTEVPSNLNNALKKTSHQGMSAGAIGGIVTGIIVIIILVAIHWWLRRRKIGKKEGRVTQEIRFG